MDVSVVNGLQRRSFAVRYLTLFAGEALGKVGMMVAFAYLARALGPREFGLVELALSITVFFMLGAESGLGAYGARVIASNPAEASTLIPQVGVIRATLGVVFYVVIFVISWMQGAEGIGILAVFGLALLLTPFSTQWVFQGLRQMQWVAAGTAMRAIVFATMAFVLVTPNAGGIAVGAAEVCGGVVVALFNSTLLLRVLKVRLVWRNVWSSALRLFGKTWYMGASDLAWSMSWYSPTIVLGVLTLGRTEEVAWLASAVRIVVALHTFVWLYFFNLLPNLIKELREGVDAWRLLLARSFSTSMWAACFAALLVTAMAPVLVRVIYGDAYAAAIRSLCIVIWVIPVTLFSGHFRFSLIAAGRQDLEFACSAVAATTTAMVAFVAGSAFGSTGAAAALLIGAIVHTVLAVAVVWARIGPVRLDAVVKPTLTCAASAVVYLVLRPLGGPIATAVACSLFLVVALKQWDFLKLKHAWEGRLT